MKVPGGVLSLVLLLGAFPLLGAPKAASNDDCLTCHQDAGAKRDDGRSIHVSPSIFAKSVHGAAGLSCVDCHAGYKAEELPHVKKAARVDCFACHESVGVSHPFHPGIARAAKGEGKLEVACADCHGRHDTVPVKDAAWKFAGRREAAACESCHVEVGKRFDASSHGRALAGAIKGAPTCLHCHRGSVTKGAGADPASLKRTQERLCLSCHLKDPAVTERVSPKAGFIASFDHSVHGAALAKGDARAPTCADCHGSHDMRRGFDASSTVNKMRVDQVCARCHESEAKQYTAGIHGVALHKGNKDAPACTDCHGEHDILSPKDPRSPVSAKNVSARVCTPCHASLKLTEKYGLPRDRTKTFEDSYHGLADQGGSFAFANCASCHGAHDIRPSSDPKSRVHKSNLAATCGATGCHPGANARFGTGKVHVTATASASPILYWIATLYVIMIVVVVGGMLGHNFLDFLKKSRHRLKVRRGEAPEPPAGHGLYLRMTLSERLQHGALAASFTLLVVTGFMLRYPDAWWVVAIRHVSDRAFDLRSLVHRISAAVMTAASLYHVGYAIFTPRGRQLVRALWWTWKDLKDPIGMLRYNLGLSKDKPKLDRFSYIEKGEYWALVWGTMVMLATGLVMWFDNTFIGLLTKLGYDIARTIHFWEAWLATLAILVWHFYWVMLSPDTYPMNMSWITGKLSEREMEEEHPLELERLRASAKKEKEPESKGDSAS
ncbi:MAG TPA: cytochrome c3 family protein [Thermoanaerobaculia bacterium]|nr:cytochrome c3 family protein [Thermoanaerobaculia bacterium]